MMTDYALGLSLAINAALLILLLVLARRLRLELEFCEKLIEDNNKAEMQFMEFQKMFRELRLEVEKRNQLISRLNNAL